MPVLLRKRPGPLPAWDTTLGEEFSGSGQNFLYYVQHIFPGGAINFAVGASPPPDYQPGNVPERLGDGDNVI